MSDCRLLENLEAWKILGEDWINCIQTTINWWMLAGDHPFKEQMLLKALNDKLEIYESEY